ncbi:MAG: hypothetical protein V4724_32890 [Pseudomonadota bacterium]
MRAHPVNASIEAMLLRLKKLEGQLRAAGIPAFLARLPCSLLGLHYCMTMEAKIGRVQRIAERIKAWLASVQALSARPEAQTELIDVSLGMRNDIEVTKRTLRDLRAICLEVSELFSQAGYKSARLARLQARFVQLLTESYETACVLQVALAAHDRRALALLRQMQAAGHEPV